MNTDREPIRHNDIVVKVAYAWSKDDENCKNDKAWNSICKMLKGVNSSIEKEYGVKVSLGRLRASHGHFVWDSIADKILSADILIFDVAATPFGAKNKTGKAEKFNANVLIELGAAMIVRPRKRVLVFCPEELRESFPSDLEGFFLTLYKSSSAKGSNGGRKLADSFGLVPAYQGLLKEILADRGIEKKLKPSSKSSPTNL